MTDSTDEKIAQLKAATREANEAIKGLREAERDLKKVVATIEGMASKTVGALVEEAAKAQIARLAAATDKAIDDTSEAIDKRFQQVADILLGEDKKSRRSGRPSIPELAEQRKRVLDEFEA